MRVLRFWTFGEQLAIFGGFSGLGIPNLEPFEVLSQEEKGQGRSDDKGYQCVHTAL